MSDQTYNTIKQDVRKAESKAAQSHGGDPPKDSNVSAMKVSAKYIMQHRRKSNKRATVCYRPKHRQEQGSRRAQVQPAAAGTAASRKRLCDRQPRNRGRWLRSPRGAILWPECDECREGPGDRRKQRSRGWGRTAQEYRAYGRRWAPGGGEFGGSPEGCFGTVISIS
jgi:hypothetical protein